MQSQVVQQQTRLASRAPLVGWLLDSPILVELLGEGVKIRVKQGHREYRERSGGESMPVDQTTARVIFLKPIGFGFTRRVAEVRIRSEDHPEYEFPHESLELIVYGKQRGLRRERLYTGEVASREQAVALLDQYLGKRGPR